MSHSEFSIKQILLYKSEKIFIKLNNGVEMPLYGLGMISNKKIKLNLTSYETRKIEGTYQSPPGEEQTIVAIRHAIAVAKIIHIDTAQYYANEKEVGDAIKTSGVPREHIFITTKLATTKDGKDGAVKAIEHSLKSMDTDYIDQYLLHSPVGGRVLECYDVLLDYQKKGVIKTVGKN